MSALALISSLPLENGGLPEGGLFEGDMAGIVYDAVKGIANNPTISMVKWPGGVVPYVIDSVFSTAHRNLIVSGMRSLEDQVRVNGNHCIRFVERTNQANWIRVISGAGCYSYVLMFNRPGSQDVSLQSGGCTHTGTIIHELLHALGFYHEQSRPDRDNFVDILRENIVTNQLHNFDKYSNLQVNTLNEPYDVSSIMHYENKAFSRNGQDTIRAKDGTMLIPAYSKTLMTDIDRREVQKFYGCIAL